MDLADLAMGGAKDVLTRWKDLTGEVVWDMGCLVPVAAKAVAVEDPFFVWDEIYKPAPTLLGRIAN